MLISLAIRRSVFCHLMSYLSAAAEAFPSPSAKVPDTEHHAIDGARCCQSWPASSSKLSFTLSSTTGSYSSGLLRGHCCFGLRATNLCTVDDHLWPLDIGPLQVYFYPSLFVMGF